MRLRHAQNFVLSRALFLALVLFIGGLPVNVFADDAITMVRISICGNSIVESGELCDGGANNGRYGLSIAERYCGSTCKSWGPYCGDFIRQTAQGEECDDGNNIAGDRCSASCKTESLPPPPPPTPSGAGGGWGVAGGFQGGSVAPQVPTKVVVEGKAYPNADVHILKDGDVVGIVKANAQANFYFGTTEVTPGVATFGFWAQDMNGLKSISFNTTFQVVQNAVTTISGALLPPTIALEKKVVKKGELLNIFGQSAPESTIFTNVNSEETITQEALTDQLGLWKIAFDTNKIKEEEFHTVKAMFESRGASGSVLLSGFSQALSFYVGEKNAGKTRSADLNNDGKVNLVDFSILLFHWGKASDVADLNNDGKVNLTDFSIMVFHWTG